MKWQNTIANYFTLSRVVLVPVLWILALLQSNFFFSVLFVITGLTDAFDGFFARKLKQASEFGAWFDSLADNLVSASLLFWLWLLLPEFLKQQIIIIGILVFLFAADLLLGYLKYHKVPSYHLYSSKVACILMYFFFAHAIFFSPHLILFYFTSFIIILSFLEEIAVTITHDSMDSNKKSIFIK